MNCGATDGDDDDGESGGDLREVHGQIRALLGLRDYAEAERALLRAVALDPLDLRTLNKFAVFLHQKRYVASIPSFISSYLSLW
jgi:Flp pilus assembly protein TadD